MPSELGAYLSRTDRVLNVAGARVVIPFAPAGAWLPHLDYPTTVAYLMADGESRARLEDALIDVPGAQDALSEVSQQLLRDITGRSQWWEGTRLAGMGAHPDTLGHLVLAGIDPWSRTLGEWCAAVYALATRNADAIEREKFAMRLAFPPAGFEYRWDDGYDENAEMLAKLPGVD